MAEAKPKDPEDQVPPRRGVLRALVVLGGCGYAGVVAAPVARFVAASAGSDAAGGERWVRVGRLDALIAGEPRRVNVVGDERDAFTMTRDQLLGSVWLVRDEEHGASVRALSATCPHLGCAVDVDADKQSFACPCHTSKFSARGDVESGPSPRGMDPLTTRVVDGFVEIDFRRYRQGIVGREEVPA